MSNDEITADGEELMKQAKMTARDYMLDAIRTIDELFGKGVAVRNPEFIVAYIQGCAIDYGTSLIAQQIRRGLDNIAERIRERDEA